MQEMINGIALGKWLVMSCIKEQERKIKKKETNRWATNKVIIICSSRAYQVKGMNTMGLLLPVLPCLHLADTADFLFRVLNDNNFVNSAVGISIPLQ